MPGRERSDAGQFVEKASLEDVLGLFDRVDGPVLTSSDVADAFGITTEAARQKFTRLYDRGAVAKRKTGRTVVYWRVDEERPEEPADAPDAGAGVQDATDTTADPPTPSERRTDTPNEPATEEEPEHLEDVVFPSTRDREKCEAAVHAARDYIREHGEATMAEMVTNVMSDHPVGYDAESDIERIKKRDERNRSTWWRKVIKPGLKTFDDIEKPSQGASAWTYVGEADEADEAFPTIGGTYDPTEEF